MTDAERLLWSRLRSRQLNGHKFRRQVPVGSFIADFLCWEAGMIVEVDGGQHDEATDASRTAWLADNGYHVVRFWNNDVLQNIEGVLEELSLVLANPHPYPLPHGERESTTVSEA
jgi:very-short-patch-repair endonuclease